MKSPMKSHKHTCFLASALLVALLWVTSSVAETYEVQRGDTMWRIAASIKGDNAASVTTVMNSLHAANPHAFIDGDINKLKAGVVLEVPESFTVTQRAATKPSPAATTPVPAPRTRTAPSRPAAPASKTVAKVATLTGKASAADAAGQIRSLARGDQIAVGDTVVTNPNSFVRMRFTDESAVLLKPNSRFQIEDYNLSQTPEDNRTTLSLLRGGFRAVTGLIGKRNAKSYRLRTAVATIGIRGTDIEGHICSSTSICPAGVDDGLYTGWHDGAGTVCNEAGCTDFDADGNPFGFTPSKDKKAKGIPKPPVIGNLGDPDCE